ncbi:YppF family protein [Neobacillus sp. YIM B06451]|uniref:YppF family protein n=1 Tax=Neobacillus sp. YIM B06451 TaxID=3070994 RepID=UPI002931A353|nr:YppF family protein [Neobacillus sp. YIM B06451]
MDTLKLKAIFMQSHGNNEACANDLRDYARRLYVENAISAMEFRRLIRDLEAEGATVPGCATDKLLT